MFLYNRFVKNIKPWVLVALLPLIIISLNVKGQDAMFTQHMFNKLLINPGYAGSSELMEINLLNRNQWLGWSGVSPNYLNATISAPFTLFEKSHGAGISMHSDKFGVNSDLSLKLIYAFQRKMTIGDGTLGIGLAAGFNNSTFDGAALNGGNDPLVPSQKITNNFTFDMDLGIYYKTEKIYFGISSTHLLHGTRDYKISSGVDVLPIMPQYYITAGYHYQMSNPLLMLVPSFLIQSDGKMTSLSFNTNIVYNNRIWGGISYNAGSAISALFGLELLPGTRFGVSYDYDTSILNRAANGSLEVFVYYGFKLKKEKVPQRYKSIRYL